MNDIEKQILDLTASSGKSADKITAGLKFIGDGNMQDGIKRLANYCSSSSYNKGHANGLIKGAGGTLGILSFIFLIIKLTQQQIKKKKELEIEGQAIIEALESIPENEAIDEEIVALNTAACSGDYAIRAYKPTRIRVVISRLKVVKPKIRVVIIAPVSERVVACSGICTAV